MITTQCRTDCMYCYADRNRKNDLTSWQIIKVIDEAHDMGGNLALTGGDIFAFPDWKEVIRKVGAIWIHTFIEYKNTAKRG